MPWGYVQTGETRAKIAATKTVHGHGRSPIGSPERRTYTSWTGFRKRCLQPTNAAYPSYGGRGITICDRWTRYLSFVEDMGLRPPGTSLNRINLDAGYDKSNCRWATAGAR